MNKLIIFITLILSLEVVMAHEGHFNVPGVQISKMIPPGQVKATSNLFVEVKEEKGIVKVLIFDHDKKDIPLNDLKITGLVKFPRKTKTEEAKFIAKDNMFEAKIDAKHSHRYTLELTVTFAGKTEKMNFNIEPQP